jgi:hypothetical protein
VPERQDRTVFYVQPTENIKILAQRLNDVFKQISDKLNSSSGASGEVPVQAAQNVATDGFNIIEFGSSKGATGALCSNADPTNKKLYLAYGAKKADDGQWVATNKTSAILEFNDLGAIGQYYNAGLTPGQGFTPTAVGLRRTGGTVPNPQASSNFHVYYAKTGGTVVSIEAVHAGGTNTTINVRKNGATALLGSNYTTTTSWASAGTVQNGTLAAGDYLEIQVVTVTGSVTSVSIQVDIL